MHETDNSTEDRLIQALERWLNRHRSPNDPVLLSLDNTSCLTPADIVREIKARSPVGMELRDLFESAAEDINEVIASLDAEIHAQGAHGASFTA
jgi:hypothetical protein